jgi:hypothetical protein
MQGATRGGTVIVEVWMSTIVTSAPVPSRPDHPGRGRRVVLGAFFVSVAVNALLGIAAILAPDFGTTAQHVLQTSLVMTALLIAILGAGLAWERHVLGPVPVLTVCVAAIGAALGIGAIWSLWTGDTVGKLCGTAATLAVAGVGAGLLALARPPRRLTWVSPVTLALLAAAAAITTAAFWFEPESSLYARLTGVIYILLAAGVVTLPVLHRIARGEAARAEAARAGATRFCPFCGSELTAALGTAVTCDRCSRAFTVSGPETR